MEGAVLENDGLGAGRWRLMSSLSASHQDSNLCTRLRRPPSLSDLGR